MKCRWLTAGLMTAALLGVVSCKTAYYGTMEKVGIHKRDILIDRVEDAQESQEEGQEQFVAALDKFKEVVAFSGGDLEERYESLNDEYEDSVAAAEKISQHIEDVESVSSALFEEWSDELEEYSNPRLKADSQKRLTATKKRYQQLIATMHKAEKSIDPVLSTLHDHVLYLKHNLNARAIDSLQGEVNAIDADVQALVREMQRSIDESQRFIKDLQAAG